MPDLPEEIPEYKVRGVDGLKFKGSWDECVDYVKAHGFLGHLVVEVVEEVK